MNDDYYLYQHDGDIGNENWPQSATRLLQFNGNFHDLFVSVFMIANWEVFEENQWLISD